MTASNYILCMAYPKRDVMWNKHTSVVWILCIQNWAFITAQAFSSGSGLVLSLKHFIQPKTSKWSINFETLPVSVNF